MISSSLAFLQSRADKLNFVMQQNITADNQEKYHSLDKEIQTGRLDFPSSDNQRPRQEGARIVAKGLVLTASHNHTGEAIVGGDALLQAVHHAADLGHAASPANAPESIDQDDIPGNINAGVAGGLRVITNQVDFITPAAAGIITQIMTAATRPTRRQGAARFGEAFTCRA